MGFDLGSLLSQFVGAGTAANAPDHFAQVAQNAPPDLLSQGLAAMFHSDQTPPFAQMAAQLFGQSNPSQQAGMLNQLLSSMGPAVLASLASGAGGGALSGLLGQLTQGGGAPAAITPEQASRLTPEQVRQIADHAEQHSPGIIDKMSGFYAEHPGLIKTLGSAALTIALAKMAQNHRG
ncbi:hypothetical protein [Methylibium sp.]|uniref:hypothetical protein n=1 Tax=Methylibium sp. TaxID=2067992 RepID=UPI003D13343D